MVGLRDIWNAVNQLKAELQSLPGAGNPVTPTILSIAENQSGNIPAGVRGWTFTAVSGTVTLGGQTIPAGASLSSANTLASNLAYTTGSNSTALLEYEN